MSAFDKVVASWVSESGAAVPREDKEAILTGINKGIEAYRKVQNPEAARVKDAEAKRKKEEAAKRKKEAEAKRKAAEEKQKADEARRAEAEKRRKEEQERRAALPPLPPSRPGSAVYSAVPQSPEGATDSPSLSPEPAAKSPTPAATLETVSGEDSACAKRDQRASSMKGTTDGKRKTSTTTACGPNLATAKRKRRSTGDAKVIIDSYNVRVKNVDYGFRKSIQGALERLQADPNGSGAGAEAKSEASCGDAKASPPLGDGDSRPQPPQLSTFGEQGEEAQPHSDPDDEDSKLESTALNSFVFGRSLPHLNAAGGGSGEANPLEVPGGEEYIEENEDSRRRALQMKRPSRPGICDTSLSSEEISMLDFPETPKSRDKVNTISHALEKHFLFSYLDNGDIAKFASIMDMESFEAGKVVLSAGDFNDTLFLILSGEATAEVETTGGEKKEVKLMKGSTFGDVGLLYECKSEMTVAASTAMECASLERKTYKVLTTRAMEAKRRRYASFLMRVPFFSNLSLEQLAQLAGSLKEEVFVEGQKLITYGEVPNGIYFVVEGALDVIGHDTANKTEHHVVTLREGEFAGHIEFLHHHVAVADVVASSATVKTARLSRRQFERLIGPMREPLERNIEEDQSYTYYRETMLGNALPTHSSSPALDEPPEYLMDTLRRQEELLQAIQSLSDGSDLNADDGDNRAEREETSGAPEVDRTKTQSLPESEAVVDAGDQLHEVAQQ